MNWDSYQYQHYPALVWNAMQNLLVSLPVETQTKLMDATTTEENVTLPVEGDTTSGEVAIVCELPKTILCSINLTDISVDLVDGRLVLPLSQVPLEPKVIVEIDQYDLRQRPLHSKDSLRPKRKAASNITSIMELWMQPQKKRN